MGFATGAARDPVPGPELCKRNFRGKRWWVLEKLWSLMQRVLFPEEVEGESRGVLAINVKK